jgi:hypothetical protein
MRVRSFSFLMAAPFLVAALLSPAATAQVRVWHDEATDLAAYRTYTWGPCILLHDDLMLKPGFEPPAVKEAVDRELKAKGRELVLAGPDAQLTCLMSTRLEGGGSTWRAYGPVLGGAVSGNGSVIGHLLLGIRDAKTGRVVWSARFSTRVSAKPEDLELMRKGVSKIFEGLPKTNPPAAGGKPLPLPEGRRH